METWGSAPISFLGRLLWQLEKAVHLWSLKSGALRYIPAFIIVADRPSYTVVDCRRPSVSGARQTRSRVWNKYYLTSAPSPLRVFWQSS